MIKIGCGGLMLAMGAGLALWLAYNLFVERQSEFKLSICGLGFICGLFFVGTKWAWEGWGSLAPMNQPKKRKKKKRRRVVDEDDDE